LKREYKIFATWRKNLEHINKARDNHFNYLGDSFCLTLVVPSCSIIGKHINQNRIRLIRVWCPLQILTFPWFYIASAIVFLIEYRRKNYDIIWAVIGEEPMGWLLHFFFKSKIKIVYDLWDLPGSSVYRQVRSLKGIIRKAYMFFLKKTIKNGNLVICGIHPKGLRGYGVDREKILQIENGTLLDTFNHECIKGTSALWEEMEGDYKILYHGYIHRERGAMDVMEAVKKLRDLDINICLLMIGPSDGATLRRLRKYIESEKTKTHVRVMNQISSTLIPNVIAGSNLCVSPLHDIEKYRWSFPVKIYEYLAMGKPVIATDLPGTSHIVKHRVNGLLYPPGDIDALIQGLRELIQNGELYTRLCENARKSVAEMEWNSVLAPMKARIHELMQNDGDRDLLGGDCVLGKD
jgi:glycosyltransferase involved in cell wall biosynthesis